MGKKWHAVYQNEFLNKRDYGERTIDDLKTIINKKLSEFMKSDLLKINKKFVIPAKMEYYSFLLLGNNMSSFFF